MALRLIIGLLLATFAWTRANASEPAPAAPFTWTGFYLGGQLGYTWGNADWSTVGQGTTFHFTARLPVRHTPAPPTKPADPRRLDGLRTLVVDDNAVNRRILHEMLSHWRMQPTLVESGAAALEEMLRAARTAKPFPLVLVDGVMPGMDGFSLAEKIQRRPELAGATVMMLSSAMPVGAAARCGELGVASFLTKPVSQSDLLDAILIAMNGSTAAPAATAPVPLEAVEPTGPAPAW